VFKTYCDDDIAADYNDNCVELKHLQTLTDTTKVNWCRTAKIGPFKPREFVTIIENRSFFDSKNTPLEINHEDKKCRVMYVASEP